MWNNMQRQAIHTLILLEDRGGFGEGKCSSRAQFTFPGLLRFPPNVHACRAIDVDIRIFLFVRFFCGLPSHGHLNKKMKDIACMPVQISFRYEA
ncbi:hypothetical protein OSB04_026613 [Centaurea solstitialis]|uniref:Uncharacterized protein n=1 Tax=Centaurea solstitialis TaxID=347529 RepID=A0AA38VYW9_9ASTR|nr:hypothetical protein OSB04_026613 [Centaurea solstitialis]